MSQVNSNGSRFVKGWIIYCFGNHRVPLAVIKSGMVGKRVRYCRWTIHHVNHFGNENAKIILEILILLGYLAYFCGNRRHARMKININEYHVKMKKCST